MPQPNRLIPLLLLFALFSPTLAANLKNRAIAIGDTLSLLTADQRADKIRLAEIDVPRKPRPTAPRHAKP